MQNDDREWYDMQRRFTSSEFIYMAAIPASAFSVVLPVDLSAWDDFRFPSRMGDCQAVASGAAFQGLAKVEVELGRVICAPRRWPTVREGEPADQTPQFIPQIQVLPLAWRKNRK
ncbi:MAG: hypothetical protein OXC66_13005 [Roseovarius sp.]|nr:hypothetical protein [Roseovarius sp.]